MADVITDAGRGPKQEASAPADPRALRRARMTAIAKAFREAKSDDEATDALEAALALGAAE